MTVIDTPTTTSASPRNGNNNMKNKDDFSKEDNGTTTTTSTTSPTFPTIATTTTPTQQAPVPEPSSQKNPLLRYLRPPSSSSSSPSFSTDGKDNIPPHLSHIYHDLTTKGYTVVPSLITHPECDSFLDSLWAFVTDVSGGEVQRDDPMTWYPPNQLRPYLPSDETEGKDDDDDEEEEEEEDGRDLDPWPHTGYSSFPDMFQSLGAGFVLGPLRELLAERLFTPLFQTERLHVSKEGFTFARPTLVTPSSSDAVAVTIAVASKDGDSTNQHQTPVMRWQRSRSTTATVVCGEVQPPSRVGEHYDQPHDTVGLHSIQSSVALTDQEEEYGDGHFLVYPYSHSDVHQDVTRGIYRGKFAHVPLSDQELTRVVQRSDTSPPSSSLSFDKRNTNNGNDNDNDTNDNPLTNGNEEHQPTTRHEPIHVYARKGDVILWRSDLIHAAVPPSSTTPNFRAVGYVSMAPACLTPETITTTEFVVDENTRRRRKKVHTVHVGRRKMDAYLWGKTGDHRVGVESWHVHRRRDRKNHKGEVKGSGQRRRRTESSGGSSSDKENADHNNSDNDEYNVDDDEGTNWVLERQRPHYRFAPPRITYRLAELYGLIPYGAVTDEERQRAKDKATIRGVRFINDVEHDDPTAPPFPPPPTPLCYARTNSLTLTPPLSSCTTAAEEAAYGSLLHGQDKYLGGMCSPCGRYVYGVPGHAPRVLKIDVRTEQLSFIGPSYAGKFKWLRGVEIPPEVMAGTPYEKSGCCLALPCNSRNVLKIDPESGGVKTFGEIEEEGWLYHGGNLASDGFVYAIPANATRVLKIDPRNETLSYLGPSYPGHQKWFGGILGSDGCIYGIPHNATGILRIDPSTQNVTTIECSPTDTEFFPPSLWKWHGGLSVNSSTRIIGFPNNADGVMVFDIPTQRLYSVGDQSGLLRSGRHRIPQDGRYKYLGGAASADGRYSYLFPCDAERVLRIDNETLDLALVGPELLEGPNKYQNGFVSSDGCLYGIPQRASGVLRITPGGGSGGEEDHVDVLYCGDDAVEYKDKFEGGVMDLKGNIYCIPLRAKAMVKVYPAVKK